MMQKLSPLAQANIHLRNEKVKYNNQKNRALRFEKLYKEEKQKNSELEGKVKQLLEEKETDKQTIEEYKRMIFHKKSKTCNKESTHKSIFNEAKKIERSIDSFKKKLPTKEEITSRIKYETTRCHTCNNPLIDIKTYKKYTEDIEAPFVAQQANKIVAEEIISSGYCKNCKKRSSYKEIPKSPIVFGENIRMFINFQSSVLRMSYELIKNFIKIIYDIEISDGEITNILEKEAKYLTGEYERLREVITDQKGVHFDETGWLVQQEEDGNYAWCMSGTETEDVLYDLGMSRGGGAVKRLAQNIKENESDRKQRKREEKIVKFVGISDGYGGYTNKFENHQLCWAHPDRKIRELSESKSLDEEKRERCEITSNDFSKFYKKIRDEIKKEEKNIKNNKPSTEKQREKLKEKLKNRLEKIVKVHKNDPKKLITYKTTIAKYIDKYFVCILIPGIPADNNKAERALRHLVLKRKISHGSITKRSASFMSVNYSVLLSIYWRSPNQFFTIYKGIRDHGIKMLNCKFR